MRDNGLERAWREGWQTMNRIVVAGGASIAQNNEERRRGDRVLRYFIGTAKMTTMVTMWLWEKSELQPVTILPSQLLSYS